MMHLLIKYLIYFGVFILGFLSAILFFNYNIKKILSDNFSVYKELYRSKYGRFSLIYFGVLKILKERKDHYKGEIESNQGTTKVSLNSPISRRESQIPHSPQENKKPQNVDEPTYEEKASPTFDLPINSRQEDVNSKNDKKINVLYFSAPTQDGSFSLENASSLATSRSYYKIEYVEDQNIGKLIYRSGNLDMSALSQMDYILGPVCEIENSSIQNPTIISIESDGRVIKGDNTWNIDQKIKIKLS